MLMIAHSLGVPLRECLAYVDFFLCNIPFFRNLVLVIDVFFRTIFSANALVFFYHSLSLDRLFSFFNCYLSFKFLSLNTPSD